MVKTTMLPEYPDAKSPAGADVRFLMDGATGNMIHSTVPPHQVNRATIHATVTEFWYVLEGHGMNIEFTGGIWYWRGPASFDFVTVPVEQCRALKATADHVTCGRHRCSPRMAATSRRSKTASAKPKTSRKAPR